jgi:hypothetical protein
VAISFVGSGGVGISTANVTFNFSSLLDAGGGTPTVQTGDIVIVSTAYKTAAVWDKTPTGYTDLYSNIYEDAATNDLNLKTSYKIMGGTPDTSVVIPASSSRGATVVHVLRGVDTTTPSNVTSTTAGAATASVNPDPPSITPTTAGSWVYCVGAITATTTSAITNSASLSSTTNHFAGQQGTSSNSYVAAGLKEDWSSGAFDAAAFGGGQSGASSAWGSASIVFQPTVVVAAATNFMVMF